MSRLVRYGFVLLSVAGLLAALGNDVSGRTRLLGRRRGNDCCSGVGVGKEPSPPPVPGGAPAPPPPKAAIENPSPSDNPLVAAPPQEAPKPEPEPLPADVTKISPDDLLKKTPNFFCYDYQFGPEPGKRCWLRVSEEYFLERYPSGKETRFDILGRTKMGDAEGTVVARVVEGGKHDGFQVFIADRTLEARQIYFRLPSTNEGKWTLLGDMKSVE